MKCPQNTRFRPWLPELAGGEIGPRERALCEAHLANCAACRQELAQLDEVIGLLRRAGTAAQAEDVPAGFSQALHLRLAQEAPPRRPLGQRLFGLLERLHLDSWGRVGSLAGVAAACAILVVLALPRHGRPTGPVASQPDPAVAEVVAPVEVPSRRVAVVHFDFVTDMTVDNVDFEVTLPRELAFVSEGKPVVERTLRWSGTLAVGSNPVPLAITGSKPGRYKIVARARGEGVDVRHDVVLEVVSS